MSAHPTSEAILLPDITGSTPLYESAGDAAAMHQIGILLDILRQIVREENGTAVTSKGDDVLSVFSDPSFALRAVRRMLSHTSAGPLLLHAGLHFGPVIHACGATFGDAVNVTARLASLAKPGEVLISGSFVAELSEFEAATLRPLDTIRFKGKRTPTQVYSLLEATGAAATDVSFCGPSRSFGAQAKSDAINVTVSLYYRDRMYSCIEPRTFVIGRSPDCDLVIVKPWVSRSHVTLTARRGKIEISDQSAAGTYAMLQDGSEVFLHRETLLLTNSGVISPAVPSGDDAAEIITYKIDPV